MKTKIVILLIILAWANTSCLDDFTNINKNPDKIYADDMSPKAILPGTVYKTLNAMARLNYETFCWEARYIRIDRDFKDTDDPGDRLYSSQYRFWRYQSNIPRIMDAAV